jgi:hypothetical protein
MKFIRLKSFDPAPAKAGFGFCFRWGLSVAYITSYNIDHGFYSAMDRRALAACGVFYFAQTAPYLDLSGPAGLYADDAPTGRTN